MGLAYNPDQQRDGRGRWTGEGARAARERQRSRTGSIIDKVRAHGGLTVRPLTGEEPRSGYVVGRHYEAGKSAVVPDSVFLGKDPEQAYRAVDQYLKDNAEHFDRGGWLGLWHDTAHGEVALDRVDVVATLGEATTRGRAEDQQAVWDVKNSVEIPTGGTGGRQETATRHEAPETGLGDDGRGATGVRGTGRGRGPGDVSRDGEADHVAGRGPLDGLGHEDQTRGAP